MTRDQPGSPSTDKPKPGSVEDLRQRLDRMPPSHPSSPLYRGGEIKPVRLRDYELPRAGRTAEPGPGRNLREVPRDQADLRPVAAERAEWQGPLERGEVERAGRGVIDERARPFPPAERRVAEYLARADGVAVVANPEHHGIRGRKPDAVIDGVPTEFKSLRPGASDATVRAALTSAKGQARHAAIDARGSGLGEPTAQHGIQRFVGAPYSHKIDDIRIIGDDYDLHWKRGR